MDSYQKDTLFFEILYFVEISIIFNLIKYKMKNIKNSVVIKRFLLFLIILIKIKRICKKFIIFYNFRYF